MKVTIVRSDERGKADYGWLKANYSYSFAQYYDPNRIHFGPLRVLNDDIIAEGMGFGEHPHDNMEIITIPLEGSLKHKDSISNEWIPLHTDEVQVMSAGSGIRHSEMNNSTANALNLFQIWVLPNQQNLIPRYDQKWFDPTERKAKLQVLVSDHKNKVENSLTVHQNLQISRIELDASKSFSYEMKELDRGLFLMVINGSVAIGDINLQRRDAVEITDTQLVEIETKTDVDLLFIEVPLV